VTVIMLLFVVDRIGRRRPLILGALGMAGCMALLGLTFLTAGFSHGGASGWLAIAGLAGFKTCYSLSWGGMVWIMLGETFPLRVRAPAMGIATFANWTGNLLVGQFFPQLLGAGTGTVFFISLGSPCWHAGSRRGGSPRPGPGRWSRSRVTSNRLAAV
jgi:MFS family permease